MSGTVGDEGGKAVEAAVESERSFIASDSVAPPLFVDRDIAGFLECAGLISCFAERVSYSCWRVGQQFRRCKKLSPPH